MNLSRQIKVTAALAYADGTAVREGAVLDMQGWDGVLAIMTTAAMHDSAVGDIHWEQDTAIGMGGAADLEGSAIVTGGTMDDKIFVSDLYRPTERYVRAVVTKDTSNTSAESVIYIQYMGSKCPVTDAGADYYEMLVSPAEGTK